MSTAVISETDSRPKTRFRWWHAVIIFVAANLISILPAGFNGDEAFYNAFRQPAVAPPDWLFAPMWLFLNITSLIALWRIANKVPAGRNRTLFFWLEGAGWVLFAVFNTLYFGLDSPVLGAADTVFGFVVGLASLALAFRLDRAAAFLVLPRILWLALASYVSVWVAANNVDTFLSRL